mmetsp:Transcript_108098/g.345278  ORF Transcript_108098/g.345278 Transcript_108098/m.345278 type:complete len:210 (+) Transcript_108098:944-1573(+)
MGSVGVSGSEAPDWAARRPSSGSASSSAGKRVATRAATKSCKRKPRSSRATSRSITPAEKRSSTSGSFTRAGMKKRAAHLTRKRYPGSKTSNTKAATSADTRSKTRSVTNNPISPTNAGGAPPIGTERSTRSAPTKKATEASLPARLPSRTRKKSTVIWRATVGVFSRVGGLAACGMAATAAVAAAQGGAELGAPRCHAGGDFAGSEWA